MLDKHIASIRKWSAQFCYCRAIYTYILDSAVPNRNHRIHICTDKCVSVRVHACRSTSIKIQEEKENNSLPKNKTLLTLIYDLRSFFVFIEWDFSTSSSSTTTFEGCWTHTKNQIRVNCRKNYFSIHMNMLWFSRKSRGKNVFFFISETNLI